MLKKGLLILLFSIVLGLFQSHAGNIKGCITDASNNEPLIGATIQVEGSSVGTATDFDGNYTIENIKRGTYTIIIKYVGYASKSIAGVVVSDAQEAVQDVALSPDTQTLSEVTVTAQAKTNTEASMVTATKASFVVQSAVSEQQIKLTQDRDASAVIRRIPGISIIDDKFVMVRGLSQRYNNVWINNAAVPSTEADSRSFTFDIIPSNQIENVIIVKSPAPEYPADCTGGFILVNTKAIPETNSFNIGIGATYNNKTHFNDFFQNKQSSTDWLGFDGGLRTLNGGIRATMNKLAGTTNGIDLLNNRFNNDWTLKNIKPIADMNLNASLNHFWKIDDRTVALMASVNYSNSYKTLLNMTNALFGAYDTYRDRSNYLRKSIDNQYNHDARIGGMLNLSFLPSNRDHRFEWKNIFNQLGKNRYTYRTGVNAQSDNEESAEYYYSSRTTYSTQFTGLHDMNYGRFNWNVGYAYANRNLPDRRKYLLNDRLETGRIGLTSANDINREYTRLDEHIGSANFNYRHNVTLWDIPVQVKAGGFAEYKHREYFTRYFIYNWENVASMPAGFRYMDIATQLMQDENYSADRLYLLEQVKWMNNYQGNNLLGAGYVSANFAFDKVDIYAGLRYEHNRMELISNTRDHEESHKSTAYPTNDIFPSVNATWHITPDHQMRLAYGKSINRPEFREVASSTYYDFDLASDVAGNPDLKACKIHNIDLRYEWYPSKAESVSLALFYKHFADPIEWTYTVSGGTDLVYSYLNAKSAYSYGIELDIRKKLGFMGLPQFSFNFNGALIKSRVNFDESSLRDNRPMQGQSPYLINTGIFYTSDDSKLNLGILYNRIGKRIVGVGRSIGTSGEDVANIPHSYEMPRNAIDFSASYKIGNHVEVKAAVRDILAENVSFIQFTNAQHKDGTVSEVKEITKEYKPGRNIQLSVSYKF